MSGYKWTTNDGWDIFADASVNVSNSEICDSFYGVSCDGDQILNISLPDNELFGAVPDCIFSLSSLQMLDLSDNNIQLTDMRGAEKAHALKLLKLSNVKIKSLDGIGNLTSLEELYLDGLSIVEPLHDELFQLTKLKTLDLQHSEFEGALPTLVGQLSHLER
jgi:Leucine-rich repeat (LRR) protein